jgi:hypothetical protein
MEQERDQFSMTENEFLNHYAPLPLPKEKTKVVTSVINKKTEIKQVIKMEKSKKFEHFAEEEMSTIRAFFRAYLIARYLSVPKLSKLINEPTHRLEGLSCGVPKLSRKLINDIFTKLGYRIEPKINKPGVLFIELPDKPNFAPQDMPQPIHGTQLKSPKKRKRIIPDPNTIDFISDVQNNFFVRLITDIKRQYLTIIIINKTNLDQDPGKLIHFPAKEINNAEELIKLMKEAIRHGKKVFQKND